MMNERIEKLIEEAEIGIFWNRDNPDYRWVDGTEEDLLKFAEMIIKECIENIEQFDHHINPAREVVPIMVSQVKQHFGVE